MYKDATCQQVTLDLGKPELYLVQTRRVRWGESASQPADADPETLVRLWFLWAERLSTITWIWLQRGRDNVGQEIHERGAGVARHDLANDFADPGVESRVQRERAMPVVFKSVSFCAPDGSGRT
jgi:hypothetical protein